MAATSQLLSELTHQVGVVLIPALGDTVLKTVEFVPVSGRRVLCVVVSSTGFIDSKLVELEESVSREELVRAGNYLTDTFGGLALRDIRDRLLVAMDDERAQVDRLLALSIALARKSLSQGAPELLMDGTAELLSQPELSDLAASAGSSRRSRTRRSWCGCSTSAWPAAASARGSATTASSPPSSTSAWSPPPTRRRRVVGQPGYPGAVADGVRQGDPARRVPRRHLERGAGAHLRRAEARRRTEASACMADNDKPHPRTRDERPTILDLEDRTDRPPTSTR
jgi:hypothetical protein